MQKLTKKNVYDLHLKIMNPFYIGKPCIKITKSELYFEQYTMAFKRDKFNIEVQDDDETKRNRILFDFMQRTFNCLDELYMNKKIILIHEIKKINWGNRLERRLGDWIKENDRRRNINVDPSLLQKIGCFLNKTTRTSWAKINTSNSNFNADIP